MHAWGVLKSDLLREAYGVSHGLLATLLLQGLVWLASWAHESGGSIAVGAMALLAGVLVRSRAWARVRAGHPDPIQALRERPWLARVLTVLPALLAVSLPLVSMLEWMASTHASGPGSMWWAGMMVATLGKAGIFTVLGHAGMRALLSPIVTDVAPPKGEGDIVFSAVAVTARARAAVVALAVAPVVLVAWLLTNADSPLLVPTLAAYVAAAMAVPLVMRRASRIAVGIDGVWVRDASQTRFFAYRELGEARAKGADVELVSGGEGVLRLQTHGEDAGRRDEVLARIRAGIARSREGRTRRAEMLVSVTPGPRVASAAMGAERYREPSISREQLWELVEGPGADAQTRTAAAEALAASLDDTDRVRMRVAASQCAEPRLRVALGLLAAEEDEDYAPEVAGTTSSTRCPRPPSPQRSS